MNYKRKKKNDRKIIKRKAFKSSSSANWGVSGMFIRSSKKLVEMKKEIKDL